MHQVRNQPRLYYDAGHPVIKNSTELSVSMRRGHFLIMWATGSFSRTLLNGVGSLMGLLVVLFVVSHHHNGT